MNYTFQRVAAFCALRLSYYTATVFVAATFLILVFTDYRSASPLYILLTLAVLPTVIKAVFFSDPKKVRKEKDLAFPLFCQKYQYNFIQYKSLSISYLLLFVLLAAWHFSYSRSEGIPVLVSSLPSLLAAVSLGVRIIAVISYRLYFHFFPLKALH